MDILMEAAQAADCARLYLLLMRKLYGQAPFKRSVKKVYTLHKDKRSEYMRDLCMLLLKRLF